MPHRARCARLLGVIFALVSAGAVPGAQARPEAPAPATPVEVARLFTGRWIEIARLPMALTRGCVAATTAYAPAVDGRIMVTEACHVRTPKGSLRSITSPGRLLDPGVNTKLRVNYPLFITWDFWILDHADDYSWYISGDPARQRLFLFTRDVPDAPRLDEMLKRVTALGYDAGRLEFPAPPEN